MELIADLRAVPTEKLTARIRHVLAQVSAEVTLVAWIHDRPDLAPVLPRIYQDLRKEGYYFDTTRLPQGGQRMRISRRRWHRHPRPPTADDTTLGATAAPAGSQPSTTPAGGTDTEDSLQ